MNLFGHLQIPRDACNDSHHKVVFTEPEPFSSCFDFSNAAIYAASLDIPGQAVIVDWASIEQFAAE